MLVHPRGFEPLASSFGEKRSIVSRAREVMNKQQSNGDLDRSRTCGLLLRRETLYPAELPDQVCCLFITSERGDTIWHCQIQLSYGCNKLQRSSQTSHEPIQSIPKRLFYQVVCAGIAHVFSGKRTLKSADTRPRMVWIIFRTDSPPIVIRESILPCIVHEFPVQQMRGHNVTRFIRRCTVQIRSHAGKIDHDVRGDRPILIPCTCEKRACTMLMIIELLQHARVVHLCMQAKISACRGGGKQGPYRIKISQICSDVHPMSISQTNVVACFWMKRRKHLIFVLL